MDARLRLARIEGDDFAWKPTWLSRLRAGSFTTAPRLWKTRRHRRGKWVDGETPDSDEATAIHEALLAGGNETYGAVTQRAADLLFRRDLATVGRVAEIGLLHPWYLLHACQSLECLD